MLKINLRDDQSSVRDRVRIALRGSASVLVVACTGWGKTVFAAALIQSIVANKKRVIFCVHRVDLIKQTAETFKAFGIPFSYIASGYSHNPHMPVQIASISTLQNRLGNHKADYVFIDEAHLSMAAGWHKVVDFYKAVSDLAKECKVKGAKLLGLTGSPQRLDGKPLGDAWDVMVEGPPMSWLIDNGFLSEYRAFAPAGIDTSQLHTRKGEFVQSELDDLMAGKAVLANAVKHWKLFAAGKRTIGFTPSKKRSEDLAAEFRANGIMAVALDGDTPQKDRENAFHAFADRDIELIINCQLFCEGFDLAAQIGRKVAIEAVLDYAPTQSLAKHLQKHGRGLRKDNNDEPHILLDLVGNFARHGLPDDEREWSLDGKPKGKGKGEAGEEQTRICDQCFAAHAPAPKCPECGHVYPVQERKVKEIEGELEELNVRERRLTAKEELANARSLEDFLSIAKGRGYKSPELWAGRKWTERQAKQNQRMVS